MSRDDIDHIPSIVPTRDAMPERGPRSRRRADRAKPAPGSASGTGAGLLARLFITIALVVAAVACAWAWQLQGQLEQAQGLMAAYEARIGDLEDRLSDTDEGMNENAVVQAAKIKELDSEVRKLWDNVWKKSQARLDALEASSARYGKSLKGLDASVAKLQQEQTQASAELAKLKSVSVDLSRLMSSAKAGQAEVERVADTLNKIDLDIARLNKRVESNEEWVGSINAFRRQINGSLTELQNTVNSLQGLP